MDDGPGRGRIEIELTEHEPPRTRGRRGAGARTAAPVSTPTRGQPPDGASGAGEAAFVAADGVRSGGAGGHDERSRLIVTAAAAGAVALLLGWVLGRAGDGDGSAQSVDAGSTTPTTTTIEPVGETLPAARVPVTTRPRARPSTTTTLAPAWTDVPVAIDPRLASTGDRIIVTGLEGGFVEIDLSAGTARAAPPTARGRGGSRYDPIAGGDWVLLPDDAGDRSAVVYRDGAPSGELVPIGGPWELYWQLDTDRFWLARYDDAGMPRGVAEVDLEGNPTGVEIDTHGLWASGADPAGGVVVTDGSGIYSARPDGSLLIAHGRALAIGVGHALVFACGDDLDSCGFSIVDRATGAERAVPVDPAVAASLSASGSWYGSPTSRPTIPADGHAALVTTSDEQGVPYAAVIDLQSGALTRLGERADQSQMFGPPSAVWSPGGRFVYYVGAGGDGVDAFDSETGEVIEIPLDGISVATLTVRSPAPA